MTPNEYQREAHKTSKFQNNSDISVVHAALTTAADAGELANIVTKMLRGKTVEKLDVLLEAGDVLWGVAEVLTMFDATMEDAMECNIYKLRGRHGESFNEKHYAS